jgi:hypothetical protein
MLVQTKTLYDDDFALWVEATVEQLKSGNFSELDLENLIEEVESLTKRDKITLESRLITLFEHALKRRYVALPECYRGWELTLNRTQQKLNQILNDSPSLKKYLQEIVLSCYQKAWENMTIEYETDFPKKLPFPHDLSGLLNEKFWQNSIS